jgi:excisionase family DNA binding protein
MNTRTASGGMVSNRKPQERRTVSDLTALTLSPKNEGDDPMSRDLTKYVTTRQAAEMLGVKQDHIRKLLGLGKVRGIKLGHDWIIFVPSIEKYVGTKSARGRPSSGTPQIQMTN